MNPRTCSAALGHVAMVAAICCGTALFMALDVELAKARIDPNDPSTWPNMAPQIRYLFIPVVAGGLTVAAVILNWLMSLVDRRRIVSLTHWVLLGASFSFLASSLPLRYLGVSIEASLIGSIAVALGGAAWIRYRFGVPRGQSSP